jgi:signal transduction histidine kinase/CheY-like chemotaxis protein
MTSQTVALFLLVAGLLGGRVAFALDPAMPTRQYVVDHWTWNHGMPEETITGMVQAPDGHLWIAHADGLVRFNGSLAISSVWPEGRAMDRSLRAISLGADGTLWAMTVTGTVVRVNSSQHPPSGTPVEVVRSGDPKQRVQSSRAAIVALPGMVRTSDPRGIVDHPPAEGEARLLHALEGNSQLVAFDPDGSAWTVGAEGWLERWTPGQGLRRVAAFRPPTQPGGGLTADRLHVGSHGRVWLRTEKALRSWRNGTVEEWPLPADHSSTSFYDPLLEDRHGAIWLGGRGRLYRLHHGQFDAVPLPSRFVNTPVTAMFEDREGAMWIGTLTGDLLRLRDSPVSALGVSDQVAGNAVNAVLAEENGDIWTHAMNHGPARWRDGHKVAYAAREGNLWYLARDLQSKTLIFGNGPRTFELVGDRPRRVEDTAAEELGPRTAWWVDRAGRRTFVARTSGLYIQPSLLSEADRQKISSVRNLKLLTPGREGAVFASDTERLWQWDARGEWAATAPGRRSDELIYTLYWDGVAGVLWVGTNRGLLTWNPANRQWGARGLAEDSIFSLARDGEGGLWAGTRQGILRIRPEQWLAGAPRADLRLTHADGLPSLNFGMVRGQGALTLANGQLLFASLEGVVVINPRHIPAPAFGPTPVVSSLKSDGVPIALVQEPTLAAGSAHVEVAFDAFSISTPRSIRVEYLLEGVDTTWQAADSRRSIQYNNLAPGTYRFRLRTSWADGTSERETSLTWTIPPHFYQTAWFRGISVALVPSLLFLGIRRRAQRTAARTAELESRVVERTRELESAKAAAEAAARVKSEFLATMSHELRTPMNGVLGIAELLAGTHLDETQHELLATLRTSGESLLAVVNDILDLSKIDSGRLQIERIPTNLPELMADLCQVVKPMADKKGLALVHTSSGAALDWIESDPARLRQVLFNLLSNAIKFTPTGRVALHAEWRERPGGTEREVLLSVQDSGIGIPAEKLPLLFENFVQVDSSTTRLYGGTGLGLAISRRLVEALGGSIFCVSTPGQGSTFSVSLPVTPAPAPVAAAVPEGPPPPTGLRVLVAEDNLTNQRVIVGLLRKIGVEATLVSNGMEAVDACQQERFDLVLMDCQMPILDGYGATRHIRQNLGEGAPPIVALTAHALESDRAECLAAGMCGYLTKPILLDQLRQVVSDHCRASARP